MEDSPRTANEPLLLRPQIGEALYSDHALAGDCGHGHDAGPNFLAVDKHGAGAALRHPTAESRAPQFQFAPQNVEQRRGWRGRDGPIRAVDI